MSRKIIFSISSCLTLLFLSCGVAVTQSDNDMPLGDVARLVRKSKEKPAEPQTVIDNDNLSKVMEDVQTKRLKGEPVFSIDNAGKNFRMTSPDGSCSLSFDANAAPLISSPYVPEQLPASELMKLDGPATIQQDTLALSVYNGTRWNVKEITVGLTVVRRQPAASTELGNAGIANFGQARLIPAVDESGSSPSKRSDLTLIYHLKGSAAPFETTVFHEPIGMKIGPDQEWHWAIIQAMGILPKPEGSQQQHP